MHPEELCSQCRELASNEPEPSESSWQDAPPPMSEELFMAIRQQLNKRCEEVLVRKGADYSHSKETGDKLGNFRRIAKSLGLPARTVWCIYFLKHVDALIRWVKTGAVESEPMDGRFIDLRNYVDLGYGIWLAEDNLPLEQREPGS